ncbi:hypothetical protein COCC4DRAFT_33768 [Bipolaris maydis ATCC 48331]|uniref:Uncharacterized protein n=2 Tax=Cochliobolus heterostrophus TaxID=5016 RepID=M2V4Q9_COCH5|nr:uncharacterized protein COCC4DRAFT_33768 [Bipolaris maydis ATCC 48331]EMD94993.1 hypothetical protein COCHEDRAFT_1019881 [Bipolaris maydis C5]ENI01716.1 hypothetical protein COCC4DRAFT_33768 [Bipolaris maydis ATCC 48331]
MWIVQRCSAVGGQHQRWHGAASVTEQYGGRVADIAGGTCQSPWCARMTVMLCGSCGWHLRRQ